MEILYYIKCMPVMRALIPLVAGIISAISMRKHGADYLLIYILLSFFCICSLIFLRGKRSGLSTLWIKGVFISFSFFLTSWILVSLTPSERELPQYLNKGLWLCELLEYPEKKKNSYKIFVRLNACYSGINYKPGKESKKGNVFNKYEYFQNVEDPTVSPENLEAKRLRIKDIRLINALSCAFRDLNRKIKPLIIGRNLKIFVYIEADSLSSALSPGDILLMSMKPSRPVRNGNPEEFDYINFLHKKAIYYQAFIKQGDWKFICRGNNEWKYLHKKIRHSYVSRISQISVNSEQYGIIAALATGSKEFLDEDIITSYSGTGAMHVLAVSGLHVGLIWFIFDLLLRQLNKNPFTRIFYLLLMLAILWFYALITAMSPSVTRAGIMLTLFAISSFLKKGNLKYHAVYLSAFIQLLINPLIITEPAFQLSYIAVLCILFFQPRIKKLFYSRNKIINYFFELSSVSLAAQIGTSFFSIYYFHKFPLYFLLTNYIVIPLVTIILVMIITSAFFWYIDFLFETITRMEFFITELMNKAVKFIESLPYSTIENIYIDLYELIIFLLILFLLKIFIINKHSILLKVIMILFCIAGFYGSIRDYYSLNDPYIILYNIPGIFALELYDKDHHYFITTALSEDSKAKIIKCCKKFWLKKGINEPLFIDTDLPGTSYEGLSFLKTGEQGSAILVFGSVCLVIPGIKDHQQYAISSKPIYPELVIVNKNDLNTLPPFISFSKTKVIAISSGYERKKHFFPKDLFTGGIADLIFYDVREQGAFYYNPIKKRMAGFFAL